MLKKRLYILVILFTFAANLFSQMDKLKISLTCNESWLCDQEFLRNELPIVDFVRDRFLCDVQIISNVQFNGNGGESNTIRFVGQKVYGGKEDTLIYFNDVTATNDVKRKKMLKYIQVGILPYLVKHGNNTDLIDIGFKADTFDTGQRKTKDPWNYFQISIGSSGFFNGNRNQADATINNSISVSRETQDNKFFVNINNNVNRSKFTYYDDKTNTTEIIKVVKDQQSFFSQYTIKHNQHFGYGLRTALERSVFDNIDTRFAFFPQIEYSILPYKDYNSSRLILAYAIGSVNYNYKDTTIYFKTKESLIRQDFDIVADFTKPWGNISVGASFTHYLHDFSKNNFYFGGAISWNVFKGLKFSMGGYYQLIHDQLSLSKQDASRDDLLTQRRLIATSYEYFTGIGFSYTFGSIYNSQVHPAFRGLNWGINF
jgi:hypothetical protein